MNENLICPVCGKSEFSMPCNDERCVYCGWKNHGGIYDETGVSLSLYKKRYLKKIEANPEYVYVYDHLCEGENDTASSSQKVKAEYKAAHRFCMSNVEAVKRSEKCGCFFCLNIFKPEEIDMWIKDTRGDTALCPRCLIDSVLPDSLIQFDREFLLKMHDVWFEGISIDYPEDQTNEP